MHNFIADFWKGGDILKSYWAKWPLKQVAFFHNRTVKVAESNIFTCKPRSIFKTHWLSRLSSILSYTNCESGKFQSIYVQTAWQHNSQLRPDHISRGSNAHEQCVSRFPVSRVVHSPGRPASVITWKISTRDPGIILLWKRSILKQCKLNALLKFEIPATWNIKRVTANCSLRFPMKNLMLKVSNT